jgi:hypothetical protein
MDFSDTPFDDAAFATQQQQLPTESEDGQPPAKKAAWEPAELGGRVSEDLLDILQNSGAPKQQKSLLKSFSMSNAIIIFVVGPNPYFEISKVGHHRSTRLYPSEIAAFTAEFPILKSTVAALARFSGPLPEGLAYSKKIKESEKYLVCAEVHVYKGNPHAALMTYYKAEDGKLNPCSGAPPVRASDEAGDIMVFVHECLKPAVSPSKKSVSEASTQPLSPSSPTASEIEAEENNRLG